MDVHERIDNDRSTAFPSSRKTLDFSTMKLQFPKFKKWLRNSNEPLRNTHLVSFPIQPTFPSF